MKAFRIIFFSLLAMCLLASCGDSNNASSSNVPKIDASSEESLKKSMIEVRDSLPESQKEEFDQAALQVMMSKVSLGEVSLAGAMEAQKKGELTLKLEREKSYDLIDGKTGQEIIDAAKRLQSGNQTE